MAAERIGQWWISAEVMFTHSGFCQDLGSNSMPESVDITLAS